MSNRYLSETEEELFFDRYFEYGEDEAASNAKMALLLMEKSHEEVKSVAAMAEDGECFDQKAAAQSFKNLALAESFLKQFAEQLPESDAVPVLKKAEEIKNM